jgi:hypothetical protein
MQSTQAAPIPPLPPGTGRPAHSKSMSECRPGESQLIIAQQAEPLIGVYESNWNTNQVQPG